MGRGLFRPENGATSLDSTEEEEQRQSLLAASGRSSGDRRERSPSREDRRSVFRARRGLSLFALVGASLLLLLAGLYALSVLQPDLWAVAAIDGVPPPTIPSTALPVCSEAGQRLWKERYDSHEAAQHALSDVHALAPAPHWSALNALLSPWETAYSWTLALFNPLEESRALSMTQEMCDFMNKLLLNFLYGEPAFHPPAPHPWHDLPPFPFPSLPRFLPEAIRHPIRTDLVWVPALNASHPDYLEGGAFIPRDYQRYTTDSALLEATWPGCFDGIEYRRERSVDVADFLALFQAHAGNESGQAALLHPKHLNTLALSLNLRKFPFERFPPPGVESIPLVITTIDSAEFRSTMADFALHMRRILAVHDSTVFISLETVRADTLQLMVEHLDFARVLLYFTPIPECAVHKPYASQIAKDWKINVSLLFIMHVVYNLWQFDYAVVLEDDMDPSRDVYLFHLAVSAFARASPDVFTVAGSSYSHFYDCYHMHMHLQGRFTLPNISLHADCADDGQPPVTEADLLAWNFTDTNLLVMERLIIPWACGYTRKYYAFLLNFFLTFTGTLGWQRYDISAHRIFSQHEYMRTLVPLSGRVHGDPIFLHRARRALPLLAACQHTTWKLVHPPAYRQEIVNPRMAYYDYVQ